MVLLCYDKERWYVNLRLYRWKTKLQEVAMKKIILIAVVVLLALFFGAMLFRFIQYEHKANSDRKMLKELAVEAIESVTMQWSIYEYDFSEQEIDEFIKLFQGIEMGETTHEHEVLQGDGCSVSSEIKICTKEGAVICVETPIPFGIPVAVINEVGYESSRESLKPLAVFLDEIENREFVNANDQTPVSAHFPFKDLKDTASNSIILKWGNRQYQFTQQEVAEFCDEYWDQAVYDKIDSYKDVKDRNDVFETELVIEKADGKQITVQLNYKVIIINDDNYLFKLAGDSGLYSYIKSQMEKLL